MKTFTKKKKENSIFLFKIMFENTIIKALRLNMVYCKASIMDLVLLILKNRFHWDVER